jgi:hypothetical protein
MPPLTAVVADLTTRPRPVLCLDTCDLLDIIQCVAEGKARRLKQVRSLIDTLAGRPDTVQLVVSYLVPIEWAQNHATVLAEVQRKLNQMDQDIAEVHIAWSHVTPPLPNPPPSYAGGGLPSALAGMASAVLGLTVALDRDDTCVERAFARVLNKTRPSHGGMIKDSVHLEHYLELARQLQASGFAARRVFVSANKADFWEAKNSATIHPYLAPELGAVGLEFFGNLEAALGSLRI